MGSHELRFGKNGELGPLDVQLAKPDELMPLSSGLDIFQALSIVNGQAYQSFEQYFVKILGSGSGNISTRTAADIATKLVSGLYTPLSAQLDPLRLGEVQRAISVARAYGERLGLPNLKQGALDRLIEQYPSHGFVVDMQEATELFQDVRSFSPGEEQVYSCFTQLLRYPRNEAPNSWDVGRWVAEERAKDNELRKAASRSAPDPETDGSAGEGEIGANGDGDTIIVESTPGPDTKPARENRAVRKSNGRGTETSQIGSTEQ